MNITTEVAQLNTKLHELNEALSHARTKGFLLKAKNLNFQIRDVKDQLARKKKLLKEQKEKEPKEVSPPKREPKLVRKEGLLKKALNTEDEKYSPTKDTLNELLVDSAMAKLFDPEFDEFLFTFNKAEVSEILVLLLKELSKAQTELKSIVAVVDAEGYKAKGFITHSRRTSLQKRIDLLETIINKVNI